MEHKEDLLDYGDIIADGFCKCGCNKQVTWNKHDKRWNNYFIQQF